MAESSLGMLGKSYLEIIQWRSVFGKGPVSSGSNAHAQLIGELLKSVRKRFFEEDGVTLPAVAQIAVLLDAVDCTHVWRSNGASRLEPGAARLDVEAAGGVLW